MASKLIIDGNAVYEIDEECVEYQRKFGKTGKGKKDIGKQEIKNKKDKN